LLSAVFWIGFDGLISMISFLGAGVMGLVSIGASVVVVVVVVVGGSGSR
jgi:hypothetical protein